MRPGGERLVQSILLPSQKPPAIRSHAGCTRHSRPLKRHFPKSYVEPCMTYTAYLLAAGFGKQEFGGSSRTLGRAGTAAKSRPTLVACASYFLCNAGHACCMKCY
jgi:hypothetical protein